MKELKCPFCQQELRQDQDGFYTCYTDNCGCMAFGGNGASGSESLWQALIDTKNKLDYTITMLERIAISPETMLEPEKIVPQLAALTLEQINKKE